VAADLGERQPRFDLLDPPMHRVVAGPELVRFRPGLVQQSPCLPVGVRGPVRLTVVEVLLDRREPTLGVLQPPVDGHPVLDGIADVLRDLGEVLAATDQEVVGRPGPGGESEPALEHSPARFDLTDLGVGKRDSVVDARVRRLAIADDEQNPLVGHRRDGVVFRTRLELHRAVVVLPFETPLLVCQDELGLFGTLEVVVEILAPQVVHCHALSGYTPDSAWVLRLPHVRLPLLVFFSPP
jgi:hypothetical protein